MSEISNPTPTVEQLCAIEACREAARRYSYGLDRLDGDVMKSAYWPEAIDEHGRYNGNAWEFCDYCVDEPRQVDLDDALDLQPPRRDRHRRRQRSR